MTDKVYPNIDYSVTKSYDIQDNLIIKFATNVRVLDSSKTWRKVYVENKFKLSIKSEDSNNIKALLDFSTSFHKLVYKVSYLFDTDAASKEPKSAIQIDEKARLTLIETIKQRGLTDELK